MSEQRTLFDDLDIELNPHQLSAARREEARQFLLAKHAENPDALEWLGLMSALREQHGLSTEEAALVAWLSMPAGSRVPATRGDLAEMLGRQRNWPAKALQQNPFLNDLVTAVGRQQIIGRVPEILNAAVDAALHEGYRGHNDRKMLLTMAGLTTDAQDVTLTAVNTAEQAAALSDAELERRLQLADRTPADDSDD